MTAPAWLTAAGLASINPAATPAAPDGGAVAVESAYPGDFATPPAQAWYRRIPGAQVPSAVHTEAGGPLLYGDYIFTGTAGEDALLMLHRADGRLIRRLPARGVVRSKPVIVDGALLYGDTGGATWCFPLDGDVPREESRWVHVGTAPVLATPAVTADRVYIADVANVLVSLDLSTGELEWRHAQKLDPGRSAELELYGHPSPVITDEMVLAGFSDGTLVALEPRRGELLWQRRVGEGQYPDLVSAPMLLGGDVVIGGFTAPLVSLDLATQSVRWRLDEVGAAHSAALTSSGAGDRVVHGGVDGILRSIDPLTGAVAWEWDSEAGSALTRPLVTPAGLLVAAASGSLFLVDADTGKRRWEWTPGFHISGITAEPDVEGRQVVAVTNAGYIVSLVVPPAAPERPVRPMLDRLGL